RRLSSLHKSKEDVPGISTNFHPPHWHAIIASDPLTHFERTGGERLGTERQGDLTAILNQARSGDAEARDRLGPAPSPHQPRAPPPRRRVPPPRAPPPPPPAPPPAPRRPAPAPRRPPPARPPHPPLSLRRRRPGDAPGPGRSRPPPPRTEARWESRPSPP